MTRATLPKDEASLHTGYSLRVLARSPKRSSSALLDPVGPQRRRAGEEGLHLADDLLGGAARVIGAGVFFGLPHGDGDDRPLAVGGLEEVDVDVAGRGADDGDAVAVVGLAERVQLAGDHLEGTLPHEHGATVANPCRESEDARLTGGFFSRRP